MDIYEVTYLTLEALTAVFCCLGNTLVILALWSRKTLKQPTMCLIVSLAAADFLVGCLGIPSAVAVSGRAQTSARGCLFLSCVVITLTLVSVLCLMAIALDRFHRVYTPLRYKKAIGPTHSWLLVAACWILAILLGFTPMFGWNIINTLPHQVNETNVCKFISVIPMSYLVYFNFFLCTLLPLFVMSLIYIYIFCTIRGRLHEKQNKSQDYLKKERQLAGSLSLVLALFALSWLPLHLMNSIAYFGKSEDVPVKAFYIGILLSHANSAINPVVYAFKIPKIKVAYVKIWRRYIAR